LIRRSTLVLDVVELLDHLGLERAHIASATRLVAISASNWR
jgi:hypothetical protein